MALKYKNLERNGIENKTFECLGIKIFRIQVFLGQKKLIGALSGASEEFLVSLKYGKSICIWRGPD